MHLAAGNGSMRCDYCKTVVIIPADDTGVRFIGEDPAGLNCPVCSVPLWNATLAGVEIHGCKQCSGSLIAMGAVEQIIDQLRANFTDPQIPSPPNPDDLKRKIDCPQCKQRMEVYFYMGGGGAVIGGCERCGLNWLDGGTLMRIVRAPHYDNAGARPY
jgi:Zn-finger nucleic acid-binding protein